MSATIKVGAFTATIDGWQWASKSEQLARILNSMLDADGPSGADPAPDYHAAQAAAKALGGKVVKYGLPEFKNGRVY